MIEALVIAVLLAGASIWLIIDATRKLARRLRERRGR